jgi:tRNA pseudouridine55 synthase
MTSHDVVHRVRRVLAVRSAGHTGTLDPFATGLLVVLLGAATRLARFVQEQPKTYLATARLGVQTDTDDLTGGVIATSGDVSTLTESHVRDALVGLLGTQLQRPPAFSAKHVAGERSYRRARRGEAPALRPSSVTVHHIELVQYRPPELTFRAIVSAGTYLRAMARDLGEQLRVGAHLTQLRREAIGTLTVEQAVPLEALTRELVFPAQRILSHLPAITLDPDGSRDIRHGRRVRSADDVPRQAEAIALLEGSDLIAIARAEDGWLQPTVVLEHG